MTCRFVLLLLAIGTTTGCVQRQSGTDVAVRVESLGASRSLTDALGQTWEVQDATLSIREVRLAPCEDSVRSPLQVQLPNGTTPPLTPDLPEPRLPAPEPHPTPRHAGDPLGDVEGGPVVTDLRSLGTIGGWRLSPPVGRWCGLDVILEPLAEHPSWSLVATGPGSYDEDGWEEERVTLPLPRPLSLSPEARTATIQVTADLHAWIEALDPDLSAAKALPAALTLSQVSW